ncbi:MAG: right-handed parallel beta-helix repeat-containing protein, partial [Actinobacteria bacterium]|nr:right-handed parallel beta-helix repeat-containing protein [Actinomycetota bacterium]
MAASAQAGPVSAAPVCGTIVKTSITLSVDVGPCSGDGLIAGADKITINLNGYTIFGDGNYENGAQSGIHMVNRSLVKVNGPGTIKLFNAGVTIESGSQNSVTGTTATLNKACNTNTFPAPQVCMDNNLGDGIVMATSVKNQVQNNTVTFNSNGNVADGGISMVFGSSQNKVTGNTVTDNGNTGVRVESGGGVKNIIDSNTIMRNKGNGVSLSFSAASDQVLNNTIADNTFTGVGTSFDAAKAVISGNTITGNRNGVALGSQTATVANNIVSNNAINGIQVGGGSVFPQDDGSTGDFIRRNNTVQNNTVNNNGRNGIIVLCAKDFATPDPATYGRCLTTTTYVDEFGNPISIGQDNQILTNT